MSGISSSPRIRPLGAAVAIWMGGCHPAEGTAPPVFGGQGAELAAQPGPAEAPTATPTDPGPCGDPRPPGDHLLIDDFEDGDSQAFKAFEREGWWWSASDDTDGATLLPPPQQFAPSPLPDGEQVPESKLAVHLKASGHTGWGAAWGTTLRWVGEGIRCPFNASKFAGIRLHARGTGTLTIQLSTPATVPATEEMGTCETRCWDHYGKVLRLADEWREIVVPFDKMQQGGWGVDARLDLTRVLGLQFSARPSDSGVDAWLDDLEFVTPAELEAWRHRMVANGAPEGDSAP